MKNEIQHRDAIQYMLGGRAYVNVFSELSNNQRRFFILAVDKNGYTPKQVTKFILSEYKVFYSPTVGKKIFLGHIDAELNIFNKWPTGVQNEEYGKNFLFVWKHLLHKDLPSIYHILHLGNCSVCNRPLTDAPSLAIGIGPICLKRIQSFKNNQS